MSIELKDIEQANKNVADLQKSLENVSSKLKTYEDKFNALDAETKEKVKKIEAQIEAKDKEIQKTLSKEDAIKNEKLSKETLVKELEEVLKNNEYKTRQDELTQRIKDLETELAKGSVKNSKNKEYMNTEHYKLLSQYVKSGDEVFTPEVKKTLRTDVGSQGGYLVPTQLYNQILEEVEELDPIRPLCRTFKSKVKTLEVPIRTTLPVASFEGETEETDDTNATYRLEQLTAYRQHINTPITWDQISFADNDMLQDMAKDASMAFAIGEGSAFLLGNGVKSPEGILINADVVAGATETATNDVLSLTDVIKLAGNLKNGYRFGARYFMNQKTLFDLRAEKDDNGNFLWRVGGEGMPNEIAGIPYIIVPSMPNVADGALSVGIGNFFYGYYILDAVGVMMIRDDYTQKKKATVEVTWMRYLTGQVGIAEAFKLLKIK
jgi:HK97 family phage major capsid protein